MKDFIVLSHPRCGTSYLLHGVLSKHPQIKCFGELFNNTPQTRKILPELGLQEFDANVYLASKRFTHPKAFLKKFIAKIRNRFPQKLIGFKIFPEQLHDFAILSLASDMKVIFLRRRNIAKSAISYEIAKITGQWNKSQVQKVSSFKADPDRLLNFARKYNYYLNNYENYLRENQIAYLSLFYEELFRDLALKQIEKFLELDVPFGEFKFADSKVNNVERYQVLISNIDEIRESMLSQGFGDVYEQD